MRYTKKRALTTIFIAVLVIFCILFIPLARKTKVYTGTIHYENCFNKGFGCKQGYELFRDNGEVVELQELPKLKNFVNKKVAIKGQVDGFSGSKILTVKSVSSR
jgi:hypothetical protein